MNENNLKDGTLGTLVTRVNAGAGNKGASLSPRFGFGFGLLLLLLESVHIPWVGLIPVREAGRCG